MKRYIYVYSISYNYLNQLLTVKQVEEQIMKQQVQCLIDDKGVVHFKDEIGKLRIREYLESDFKFDKTLFISNSFVYEGESSTKEDQKQSIRFQVGEMIRTVLSVQIENIQKQLNKLK